MVGWPSRRRRDHAREPQGRQVQLANKDLDHPHGVVLGDVVFQTARQQRLLCPKFTFDKTSGDDYVSLSFADTGFGPKKLYANLGRAAGLDDENVFAVIWNPAD